MKNYSKGIRAIYAASSLAEIARWAKHRECSAVGDLEFSDIQRRIIQSHFTEFGFDFLTTSLVVCNHELLPVETDIVCLNIADALANGYAAVAEFDDVSPLAYMNTGRAISTENLRTRDEWMNHPIYERHCRYFSIDKMMTISFQCREHENTSLAFEYISSPDQSTWNTFDHRQLELASFPFALAWFYRKGLMDEAKLTQRFNALSGLTETKLMHIRKYVNSPALSFVEQAEELGISEAWLKENLYETRNQLAPRLEWDTNSRKTPTSLRLLEREFQFMDMLGDPNRFISLSGQTIAF